VPRRPDVLHLLATVATAAFVAAAACGDTGDTSVTDTALDGGADTASEVAGLDCAAPFVVVAAPSADPPFSGTAFVTDDLITDADPTAFVDLTYAGQGSRSMFDRRTASFITVDAHLFDARFGATKTVEIQVNPEMSAADAEAEARFYAAAIGRIPAFLFRDLDTVWIHRGMQPFGGGNRNLLIHTEQGQAYVATGSLEEIFIHEGAHTSLDAYHVAAPRWIEARNADGVAISTYARDNPTTEDVSESLGPYLAVRFGADRVPVATLDTIRAAMPNRIKYLDCLGLTPDILR